MTAGAQPPPRVRRLADALLVFTAVSVPLSTTGMQAGVVALAGLTLFAAARGWAVVRRTPLDGVLALFIGSLALSTLASGHVGQSTGWGGQWVVVAYFVVFWWLRDAAHAARVTQAVVVAATVVAAYGVLQHFTGADWYRAALGRRTFVRPREIGADGYAVVGFFRNYLTFAHTMLFPLAWAGASAVRGNALGLVATPLILAAILFSTARGALLATVAAGAALLFVARGRALRQRLAGVGAAAACAAFLLAPDLAPRAAHMFHPGGENSGRIEIYRANLDIVHAYPVFGLGFGRYRAAARPYYEAHPAADRRSHAHSNYLQLAAEAGLLGLAAFGLLYAVALRHGWRAIANAADERVWASAAGAWAGVLAFLVGGVTQYSFGDSEVALAMWLALGVAMRCADGPSRSAQVDRRAGVA
jgi:putative inorganic carbon (HCO3(-)) transporter